MVNQKINRKSGMTTIVLVVITSMFVIAPLGMFAFELARLNLAREELRAATDAAALAAAAGITDGSEFRARLNARDVFRQNTVTSVSLRKAAISPDASKEKLPVGESRLSLHVANAGGKGTNTQGALRVEARGALGYSPAFADFLPIKSYTLNATSVAGVPKLDMIIALDVSQSMAEDSPKVIVRRFSVGNGQTKHARTIHNEYVELAAAITNDDEDSNAISNDVKGYGSAYQPQRMGSGEFKFNPELRNLDGNTGTPPGNLKRINGAWTSTDVASDVYTDNVVDLRKRHPDIFPDIATVVESSRGNLDNMDNFRNSNAQNSGINPALVGVATRAKYEEFSRQSIEPFYGANSLVRQFVTELHQTNDVHFSLIPFATLGAQPATDPGAITAIKDYAVSGRYRAPGAGNTSEDGIVSSPLPQIGLKADKDNFNEVIDQLGKLTPMWGTNTADALYQAQRIVRDGTQLRSTARPVVVLVTDGLPVPLLNSSGSGGFSNLVELNNIPENRIHRGDAMINDTYRIATELGDAGVPIYTVGFLHNGNPFRVQKGTTVLSTISKNSNNASGFYLAENVEELRRALRNVQRQLITLQN